MKSYIKYLIKLIKHEKDAEIALMVNEIKKLSPQKREKLGRAINNLKGKVIGKELGYTIVQYGRREIIDTEIKVGDVVLISRGNPLKSDLTGTVTEKGGRFIKIAIENIPKWALKKDTRIDLYVSDVTFKRMEDNLNNLSKYGQKALEYLLDEKTLKKIDTSDSLNFEDNNLNESQKSAVNKCLNSKEFFLVHGPFGTGKTRTLIELINQEYEKGSKILATGESNGSVDNILDRIIKEDINCTRLGHPQRVSEDNIQYTLAYKVENHPKGKKIKDIQREMGLKINIRDENTKPSPQFRRGYSDREILINASKKIGGRGISPKKMISMGKWLEFNEEIEELNYEIKRVEDEIVKDIIKNSDVILSTNSSAALEFIEDIIFDVAIIDESSQATIPSVLIPIAKAQKFILAGDHKQLPPTVISEKAKDLEDTLFEKLIDSYEENSTLLNIQYRMNEKLMEFPNKEFYNGKLKTWSEISNITMNDLIDWESNFNRENLLFKSLNQFNNPLLFIDTKNLKDNKEKQLKDSKSIINKIEAEIVKEIVDYFLDIGISKKGIGIISPYMDQVNYLKNKVKVETKTVDGFQGREKEIIIISFVRSNEKGNIGFLKDLRRLNVSITRSKRKLIIIGNSDTLKNNKTYSELVDFFKKEKSLVLI
ncbi:IGHMBP2 family helicase [Methanobrevibacter sp. OttesenSCG-928-K11]|nr:IGHMBP2 family helicase [Methanobrevibacter sp. OttesenSCG-928-K11]MDL2270818.1 IGHMBP2 family helicase [Methanobrevibacter sp. OttesenSCG-928-I08]